MVLKIFSEVTHKSENNKISASSSFHTLSSWKGWHCCIALAEFPVDVDVNPLSSSQPGGPYIISFNEVQGIATFLVPEKVTIK